MKNTVYLCHNRPATAATICSEANTEGVCSVAAVLQIITIIMNI